MSLRTTTKSWSPAALAASGVLAMFLSRAPLAAQQAVPANNPAAPATPAAPQFAVADHAIVSGFERFHAGDQVSPGNAALENAAANQASLVDGGLLLLGELNCTSCHQADFATERHLILKQAPLLGEIGSRADPRFFERFIASTHTVKPGTTMPSLLAHLPPEEAAKTAQAIAQYLASLASRKFVRTAPDGLAVAQGEELFHNSGCVACHAPRIVKNAAANPAIDDNEQPPLDLNATSIPLSRKLHEKYSLAGLVGFLLDPLAVRPSGRMPHLNLSAEHASDIAQYLLKDTQAAAPLTLTVYEGNWDKLPDFAQLKPKSVGNANSFQLGPYAEKNGYALVFAGYLTILHEGEYSFFLSSDDGSRLEIDDKVVVDLDEIHGTESALGKIFLNQGQHKIRVSYFEAAGEAALEVNYSGPQVRRQPIPTALLSNSNQPNRYEPPYALDPALAARGKELFFSVGCANCHQLGPGKETFKLILAASLDQLKTSGGCLSQKPEAKRPYYQLNAKQVAALTAALQAIRSGSLTPRDPAGEVHARMTALNCYACHNRGDLGGVIRERDAYFTANSPDLGDEGRIPPPLTGVGDKLLPEALAAVLTKGSVARPYMETRMPQFGAANLANLDRHIVQLDRVEASLPRVPNQVAALRTNGHKLVGKEGLSCISCHMFNRHKSLGIQAMDLTIMKDRLRPEWFHRYMLNPSEYRPGTRMPQAFVNGKSTKADILDADADRQIQAIWTYLLDGRKAKNPAGLIPAGNELIVGGEAVIYRNFIEGAGSRAIGVGYPEGVNIAFDANQMRLALIWQGRFIDASKHWNGRGEGFQPPLGDKVIKFPEGAPFAVLPDPKTSWPKESGNGAGYRFGGYVLDPDRAPIFAYGFVVGENPVAVTDDFSGSDKDDERALIRVWKFMPKEPVENLYARLATGQIEPVANSPGSYRVNEDLVIAIKGGGALVIRSAGNNQQELLLPLKLGAKPLEVLLEYRW